ncbi:MAG: IPT/TIG domain-containing protein, partial [Saprospiraceae bacterium]|nr:IPT/TIG domain-containing protein [Saprospiraceae bacterium]
MQLNTKTKNLIMLISVNGIITCGKKPLHGGIVSLLIKQPKGSEVLTKAISNADGRYSFFKIDDNFVGNKGKTAPQVRIQIEDLDGQIIYTGKYQKYSQRKVLQIDVRFSNKKIEAANFPEVMDAISGGIIPNETFQEIRSAFEFVTDPGDTASLNALNATFFCPLPPIHEFDNIIDLAKGVIRGRTKDIIRYRQLLEHFEAWDKSPKPTSAPLSDEQVGAFLEDEYLDNLEKQINAKMHSRNNNTFICQKKLALITTAALLVSDGDARTMHKNLRTLNRQLHGLNRVKNIHHIVRQVFGGDIGDKTHLLKTMKFFGGSWGPDDGPPRGPIGPWPAPGSDPFPFPPVPGRGPIGLPVELEDLERWTCTMELIRAFREAMSRRISYSIDSISPERACPGEELTITGSNFIFEGHIGSVVFQTESDSIFVAPESWTATEIKVIVPEEAICGYLDLNMPLST